MSPSRIETSFEASYLERAATALGDEVVDAVSCDRRPVVGRRALAGWWCRPGAPGLVVLPNPWDDRAAIKAQEARCWEVTRALTRRLAEWLDDLHSTRHGERYWDLVLGPLLGIIVCEVMDRRLFALSVHRLVPDVPAFAGAAPDVPATSLDAINTHFGDEFNRALVGELLRGLGHPVQAPAPQPRAVPSRPGRLRAASAQAALLPTVAAHTALSAMRGRRLALLGQLNLSSRDLLWLAARVRGMRVAPNPLAARAALRPPGESRAREGLAELGHDSPLEQAVVAVLGRLLPRTLIEGYPELVAASRRRFGPPVAAIHGSYGFYDLENEFLARCEAAGRPLAFAQHGGATLQLAVAPGERLEGRASSVRVSWGATGPGVRAAANPYVARLLDRHRGGSHVVIVESVTPPMSYSQRLSTIPLGNQVFAEEERLVEFVRALGAAREHVVLKRFPYFNDGAGRHPALEALPTPPGRPRGAAHWMRRARVAVVTYPDTPFIEAMALGTPTIGLWDPALWGMRPDAAGHFERLEALGVIHADPRAAARHLDAIYDDPAPWWRAPELHAAREAFLARFAMRGDWRREWTRLLRELAS
jgi:putative transferase (TIGR04331 family)